MISSRLALAAALVASFPAVAQVAALDSSDASGGDAAATSAAAAPEAPPGSAEDAHPRRTWRRHRRHRHPPQRGRRARRHLGARCSRPHSRSPPEHRRDLARQPGVTATSFGPTASAPVLRGLSGDRVRVLTDGIGTLDLSSSGPDHAIAINPLTAERIEVLRGPSALAVRLVGDRRRRQRHRHAHPAPRARRGRRGDALAELRHRGRRALGQRRGRRSARRQFRRPRRRQLVEDRRSAHRRAHPVEGAARASAGQPRSGDSRARRSQGRPAQFARRTRTKARSASPMSTAASTSARRSPATPRYIGVPIRYSLDPAIEAEAPTIDLEQTRYDARAEIPVGGFFSQRPRPRRLFQLSPRRNRGHRRDRLELLQQGRRRPRRAGPDRALRLGRNQRHPISQPQRARSAARRNSCPTAARSRPACSRCRPWSAGRSALEGGARVEFSRLTAEADEQLDNPRPSRKFTTVSGSLGGAVRILARLAGRAVAVAQRARAVDRRAVRQRPAWRQPVVRGRRPGPRPRKEPRRSKLACAAQRGRCTLTAQRSIYSHFSNFIFQAADRRGSRTICRCSSIRQGQADYLRVRGAGDAKLGEALGVEWGGELSGRRGARDDQGFRPGAVDPAVADAWRADRRARPVRRPARGRARLRATTAPRRSKPIRRATRWSTPRSTGTRSPPSRS